MTRICQAAGATWALLGLLATGCCGPLACGGGPLRLGGCASGCGERYVDPWINHPPERHPGSGGCDDRGCDPCGGGPAILPGVPTLFGYRYDGGCCDAGGAPVVSQHFESGCASCNGATTPAPQPVLRRGSVMARPPYGAMESYESGDWIMDSRVPPVGMPTSGRPHTIASGSSGRTY